MTQWWLKVGFEDEVKRMPVGHIRVLIYATVMAIAYADHQLGYEYGFSYFYLLPVILATRNLGKLNGFLISAMAAGLWAMMDKLHGIQYKFVLAPYWLSLIRFTLFSIMVFIFDGWEKEKENARTDTLTLIANRRAFEEFGQVEIKRCRRYGHPFSIIYLDVDNFKTINDRFGHKAGDKLLTQLAQALRASFRETDIVARLGGDEFSVILVETDARGARTALDRVCDTIENIPHVGSIVTLSIGLLTYVRPPDNFDEAVKKADELMYLAKNKGKNCIESAVIEAPLKPGEGTA
jgi:diguanylate cyclase (GGDEF)-like protein